MTASTRRRRLHQPASDGLSRPARIFSSQRGAKSQEYFMYFKIEQRICGGKRPAAAEDTFNQRFLRIPDRNSGFQACHTGRRRPAPSSKPRPYLWSCFPGPLYTACCFPLPPLVRSSGLLLSLHAGHGFTSASQACCCHNFFHMIHQSENMTFTQKNDRRFPGILFFPGYFY